jgi:chloride channel 7
LQSLDYDICENHLLLEEERTKGYKFIVKKNLARWMIFLLIGLLTALIACVIDITIEELSTNKYKLLKKCILTIITTCWSLPKQACHNQGH